MRWMSMYLIGYVLVVGGIIAALWKVGILERIGGFWLGIGLVILVGIGIIMAVQGSGRKEMIEIDRR